MWALHQHEIPSGLRLELFDGQAPLSRRAFLELLERDADFPGWLTDAFASTSMAAFFWELPPLARKSLDLAAECVLIGSDALAAVAADPTPFEARFAQTPDRSIVVFESLGGDAVLVAPAPLGPRAAYPHLAAFLREGPDEQVEALWRTTAAVVRQHLSDAPRWLSTAGLGVAWLHVRLDSRPKYYRHVPYTRAG